MDSLHAVGSWVYSWLNWPNTFVGANSRDFIDAFPDYAVYATVLYLVMVFYLPGFLKRRNLKWELKYVVASWNLFLAVFSIMGTYHVVPLLVFNLGRVRTFYQACCEMIPLPEDDKLSQFTRRVHEKQWEAEKLIYKKYHPDASDIHALTEQYIDELYNGPRAFFVAIFLYMKTPELLDTLFLILQGKPVSFLHWFHHLVTAIYCWHGSYVLCPSGIFFIANNYTVHSVMYLYYFLVMMGLRERIRPIAPLITLLQCLQMFAGSYVTGYMYLQYWLGPSKQGTWFYAFWELVFTGYSHLKHEALSLYTNHTLVPVSQLPAFNMEAHFYGCQIDRTNLRMAAMMFGAYCVLFVTLFYELYFLKTYNGKSIVVKRAKVEHKIEPSKPSDGTTSDENEDSCGEKSAVVLATPSRVPKEGQDIGRTKHG